MDTETDHVLHPGVWRRPMQARRSDEVHRTATTLELFFDLCFVVAVAQAASGLHHEIAAGHVTQGLIGYLAMFFAIWWAWMNFTWFASAYDTDDVPYRLTTLVQIAGALVLAAGVPRAIADGDFAVAVSGYVLMRLAMVAQWLRAARSDPEHRRCCLTYAAGIAIVQVAWVARLAVPESWGVATFVVLALAELAVPVVAERRAMTTWHPEHIAERYGLFTIIVLGESVLAFVVAVQTAIDETTAFKDLASLSVGGLLTVFGMWWIYFAKDGSRMLTSLPTAIAWGYGHFVVFASAAASGAGLVLNVDVVTHHAEVEERTAALAYTVPVAVFLLSLWALHLKSHDRDTMLSSVLVGVVGLVLLSAFTPEPVLVTGLLVSALVTAIVLRYHVDGRRVEAMPSSR